MCLVYVTLFSTDAGICMHCLVLEHLKMASIMSNQLTSEWAAHLRVCTHTYKETRVKDSDLLNK